jgi:hypothetical protein
LENTRTGIACGKGATGRWGAMTSLRARKPFWASHQCFFFVFPNKTGSSGNLSFSEARFVNSQGPFIKVTEDWLQCMQAAIELE